MLKQEDLILENYFVMMRDPELKKTDKAKVLEDIEKCRIRTQAYFRQMHMPPQHHRRFWRSDYDSLRSIPLS